MINKIHDIVLDDPKVKVHEIAEILSISSERVVNILHTRLWIRKLCARLVPQLLTMHDAITAEVRGLVGTGGDTNPSAGYSLPFLLGRASLLLLYRTSQLGLESLPHPPYSPDLASNDYYTIYSQTSRDGYVVGVLSRIKKFNRKQKDFLEGLTNRIIWKA